MKPYSNNIVFVDTEFTDLDPYKGEILSVGIIKPNGEELYIEIEYNGDVHPWVKENILPTLTESKLTRNEAKTQIAEFVGNKKPHMLAFVPQYDMIYMTKLFGVGNMPFHWMGIDFASIMFGNGINPAGLLSDYQDELLEELGIDKALYRSHHALDDARLLRDVYLKMTK